MYTINQKGPWPIIDIGAATNNRSDTLTYSADGAALNVLLDTANLGSKSEAFVTNCMTVDPNPGFLSENCSFGVLLQPLMNVSNQDEPIYLDINIKAVWDMTDSTTDSGAGNAVPFIGLIDSALSPADGWDGTNNLVSKYHAITGNVESNCLDVNTQILLKDVVSGSIPNDDYVCVGFYLRGLGQTFTNLHYTINARYSQRLISTSYDGA